MKSPNKINEDDEICKRQAANCVLRAGNDPAAAVADSAWGEIKLQPVASLQLPGAKGVSQMQFSPDSSTLFAGAMKWCADGT